jgi:photosystem II stability/assembly factor-like uncharacterized protein
MNRFLSFFVVLGLFVSCKTISNKKELNFNDQKVETVQIDTLFQDKISIRALVLDKDKVWYAADQSRYGLFDLKENKKYEFQMASEIADLEFRSMAQTSTSIFILNVGNPALLYQISKKERSSKLVYREEHEKVFYDSMQFWNDLEGIAVGDPIEGCFSVIITKDGGNSWLKIPASQLPKLEEGEAAFAASNSNVVIKGNHTWIVSGGKKSRIFYSPDKGITWVFFDTPIVQGKQMTGIFTADFYDAKTGFISGGNYEIPTQNFDNKAQTQDGGKTWDLVAQNQGFGYASCVQYFTNSGGKKLVSVGASGLFYSADGGLSWKQLAIDTSLFTIRFLNDSTAIAAGKNKMIRIRFQKK